MLDSNIKLGGSNEVMKFVPRMYFKTILTFYRQYNMANWVSNLIDMTKQNRSPLFTPFILI